jgi:UDP-N-acetylglucosamine--N-acetylmuramyl-(pentapeptide) pyrophosphoryl-undecaprenol N-acetylglucosamine transferase
MKEWGGDSKFVASAGLPAGLSAKAVSGAAAMLRAVILCRSMMRAEPPDVLLAMGGYASVGPAIAARLLGAPVVLHEANAVPGRAVSFLSRFALATAVSFPGAAAKVTGRSVVTGFPVRPLAFSSFDDWPNPRGLFTVLVMGGSQGAHALNMLCCEAIASLGGRVRALHLAGMADEADVRRRYMDAGTDARVFGFLSEMGRAYGSADFAVCRAGAASCFELESARMPALLVPLPGAPRDHQTANARSACAGGGMEMRAQRDISAPWLRDYLAGLAGDRTKTQAMKERLAGRTPPDAAREIADLVESAGNKERK